MWKLPAILLLGALPGAADTAAEPLIVSGDRTYDAVIDGVRGRLRVEPGAASAPILNSDFAERAKLKRAFFGIAARIGPVKVEGWTTVLTIDFGHGVFKRRGGWFAQPFVRGADGAIGPGGLPMDRVEFRLAAPRPGERSVTLPLADFGYSGMGATLMAGERRVTVRFSLDRERSVATAGAGAAIAEAFGGSFDRPPERMRLHFGVERPVRHLALARPLVIGPLTLDGLMVRTGDFGSTAAIPDALADPDEIVVTGDKKGKREYRLEIGRDQLDRCSSIVFDKQAKTLTLSCR